MTTWLPRGLVFAIGMVVLRLVQGTLINASPTNAGSISFALCAVLGAAALLWGLLDGIADARANPDPDRRRDLAMRWLLAGLLAGVLSGLAAWIISLFYSAIYTEGVGTEVSVFAAFTALLVFLPAVFGTGIGRWLVDRGRPAAPRQRMPGRLGEQQEDVFDAVYADEDPGEQYAVSRRELDWRQEAREAVRTQHEDADRRLHDRE
jgi:hypothetical protein